MDDAQLLRYSRQIFLPQIGIVGQQELVESTALIIGLGGLGSPVSMYLAAAGVGHLILSDIDRVDVSNLQRQIVHDTSRLGQYKATSAQTYLHTLNPDIKITVLNQRLSDEELQSHIAVADVVIDCTDNFASRFAINAACVRTCTPLVSGAAIHFSGQVSVFLPSRPDSPCYRCLYTDEDDPAPTCSERGVFTPLVGVVGSLQAAEAIKILLNLGDVLCGKLLLFDSLTMEWRTVKLRKDPDCPVCSKSKEAI